MSNRRVVWLYTLYGIFFTFTEGLKNGLDLVPPMGWSNWENSGCNINETYVLENAAAIKRKGLQDVGFTIIEIDDCWAESQRNSSGFLRYNASRFPRGMKAIGDDLHASGFKFGMYSSAGVHCCQNTMPGSLGYEWIDAKTFAEYGVDFLKYDGCFMEEYAQVLQDSSRRFPFTPSPVMRYPIMSQALNKTGRNISFMCNFPWQFWGLEKDGSMGGRWVAEVCNSWRVAGDPQPGFQRALGYVNSIEKYADFVPSGPGAWATLDAIEIGNNQSFDVLYENSQTEQRQGLSSGGGGMTEQQERAVLSLYVIAKTPLFIGSDVTKLEGHSLEVFLNKELIAIHQDPLGSAGRRLRPVINGAHVWGCALSGNRAAAVLVNAGDSPIKMNVKFAELGLEAASLPVYDVWQHKSLGKMEGVFDAGFVQPSSCVVVVIG